MNHWLAPIKRLIDSPSSNLRDLAALTGADPEFYYVNQNLSGCDLRGQDLRGMRFDNSNIQARNMDEKTLIDPEFDPRFKFHGEYITVRLSLELAALVYGFADSVGYTYKAWAIKNLIESSFYRYNGEINPELFINQREDFSRILEIRRGRTRSFRVHINVALQERAFNWASERGLFFDRDIYARLILISMVIRQISRIPGRDYSDTDPLDLFVTARKHLEALRRRNK